jgi:hypothetical protein
VFHLIDLCSQADFIPRKVRQPRARFLAWLRLYGEVTESPARSLGDDLTTYDFASPYGLHAGFLMNDADQLWLVGDHVFQRVWKDDELDRSGTQEPE